MFAVLCGSDALNAKLELFSLVDDITFRAVTKADKPPTASAILGPFWRADAPTRENGSSITFNTPSDGQVAFMHGQVTCAETGEPLANATVDVWQASTNGNCPALAPYALKTHIVYRTIRTAG